MSQDAKWRRYLLAALRSTTTYIIIVIGILIYIISLQQAQIEELQAQVAADHDGSTYESYSGRLFVLEGLSNKHGQELEDQNKIITQLREQVASLDWQVKQLQWLHPEVTVTPPTNKAYERVDFDPNPNKVPDPSK